MTWSNEEEAPKLKVNRGTIRASWVVKHLLPHVPETTLQNESKLQAFFSLITDRAKRIEPLSCSSITEDDLTDMLNLKSSRSKDYLITKSNDTSKIWSLPNNEQCEISNGLYAALERLYIATMATKENEAWTRMMVEQVLIEGIIQAMDIRKKQAEQEEAAVVPLIFVPEHHVEMEVTYKNKSRLLNCTANYVISDQAPGSELNENETSLFVAVIKKLGNMREAVSQLIGNMGIIHNNRKALKQRNAVVYGLATDSYQYTFFQIDNDAKLIRSKDYDWRHFKIEIISFLTYILTTAIKSSPIASPNRPSSKQDRTLTACQPSHLATTSHDDNLSDEDIFAHDSESSDDILEGYDSSDLDRIAEMHR